MSEIKMSKLIEYFASGNHFYSIIDADEALKFRIIHGGDNVASQDNGLYSILRERKMNDESLVLPIRDPTMRVSVLEALRLELDGLD